MNSSIAKRPANAGGATNNAVGALKVEREGNVKRQSHSHAWYKRSGVCARRRNAIIGGDVSGMFEECLFHIYVCFVS